MDPILPPTPPPGEAASRRALYRVIACEIAFREVCHCAATARSLLDLEFLSQGLHDVPQRGVARIQERVDAVEPGRYDAILLGYALCGNIISGLRARHTPLVVPRAHDCITFFLGSKERYARMSEEHSGTYYYTSGWLECLRKRGEKALPGDPLHLPSRAGMTGSAREQYERWVAKYGEEKARYLLSQVDRWTAHYHTGALIGFDFDRGLNLESDVRSICTTRGWQYRAIEGDLGLLRRWLDGEWNEAEFLVIPPGHQVVPSYDTGVIRAEPGPTPAP